MNTIFRYAGAVAILALLPMVSLASSSVKYAKLALISSDSAAGLVYASASKDAPDAGDFKGKHDTGSVSSEKVDGAANITLYAHALAVGEGNSFAGWYSDEALNTFVSSDNPHTETISTESDKEDSPKTVTLYAKFVQHVHSFGYTINGDTITKACTGDGCPGGVGGTATMSIASSTTYTANPITATTSKTGDVVIDGLSYATAAGAALGGAPTDVGDYKVTMSVDGGAKTLTKTFSIIQATIDSVTFNPASQNYDGSAKSTAMTVKAGALTLGAGDYDVISGQTSAVGSPAEDCSYTVTVQGKGNFTGTASATWTIVAPSGSFAADAASGLGCTASGNTVTLTDSLALNPTYDSEKGTWKASMTIAMPAPVTKDSDWNDSNGSAKYLKDSTTFVTVGDVSCSVAQSGSIPGMSFANAKGSYASSKNIVGSATTTEFTYLSSLTYTLDFSVADIEAAKAAGKIEKSITVWSIVWSGELNQGHDTGLKATTYTLTIPIDDKLILQDTEGRQIYPPHQHSWSYAVSADGKSLVATCQAQGCPQQSLSVGFTGDVTKTYDEKPFTAQLTDSTEFVKHTGAEIGSITYDDAADAPVSAGEHTAKVVIAVGGGSYTISQTMTIAPAAFDLSLSISTVNYDGAAKTVTATAKFGQTTLTEGTDYTISGDDRTQTGSPASDQTYTVTATGKGNFANCEKSATWTIKAPSGSAGGAAEVKGSGQTENAGTMSGNVLTVDKPLNLCYLDGSWYVGIEVSWPSTIGSWAEISQKYNVYTDVSRIRVSLANSLSSTVKSMTGTDIQNGGGTVQGELMSITTKTTSHISDNFTYVSSILWYAKITSDMAFAARDAGAENIELSMTTLGLAWDWDADGVKQTTYTIRVPMSTLVLNDDQGIQIYPEHQHSWSYEVSADGKTLVATCQAQGCPQQSLSVGFTGATSKVYDTQPFIAQLTDSTEFVKHTGAAIGEVSYSDSFHFAGTYQASVTVTVGGKDYVLAEAYTIDPRPLVSMTLSATSFDYDATEKSVTIAEVDAGGGIKPGTDDYDVFDGSVFASVGSGTEDQTYTVTVLGKGNFTGTAFATWTIKAAGTKYAFGAVTKGCDCGDLSGTTLAITKSTGLVYEGNDTWSASLTVAVPNDTMTFVPDKALYFIRNDLRFLANDDAAIAANGISVVKAGVFGTDYNYVTSFTWTERFTLAEVQAAFAGEGQIVREIRAFSPPWWGGVGNIYSNNGGLREVTYTMTMDVTADYPVLNDNAGVQKYPPHKHSWSVLASGEPVNTLTATCSADGCPQSPLTLALAAVSRDYNGAAFAATLTGADAFRTHVGATVSDIVYWADEKELVSAPKYTGSYEAHVVATVLGETYTLKVPFAITKPTGGYSDGYEVKSSGVRYDTWAEAVAAAATDDTIVAHTYKDEHDMVTYDFSSDKELTVDLCGETLKQTDKDSTLQIVNNGTGAVTLTNGEFNQPTHQSWFAYDRGFDVIGGANGGKVVFGAGLKLTSRAGTGDGDQVPTVTVKNVALEIAGGQYQVRGISAGEGGSISIRGGQFWSNFNPSAYVAQGYAVQEISGDYKYEVVKVTTVAASVTKGEGLASLTFNDVAIDGTQEVQVDPGATVAFAIEADDELTIPLYKLNGAAVAANGTVTVTEATNLVFTAVEAGGSGASDAEIAAAVEAKTGVDVVGRTGGAASDVALWLKKSVTDLTAVKDCDYLKASFELCVDLITDETTVDITDFEMSEGMSFTITLDKDAVPEVINAAAEKLASRIHAADALDTDFKAIDVKRLTVDAESGTVTIAPKTGATSEFLKVLIEKDN